MSPESFCYIGAAVTFRVGVSAIWAHQMARNFFAGSEKIKAVSLELARQMVDPPDVDGLVLPGSHESGYVKLIPPIKSSRVKVLR